MQETYLSLCKPQFFAAMIASATNQHIIMQNINFEILILKPKINH